LTTSIGGPRVIWGNLGYEGLYITEDKEGAEDAVHNWDGIFILYDPKRSLGRALGIRDIVDIAPTILKIMDLEPIEKIDGKIIEEFF
jgi:predicted AlkP superfamily phosphohydrolase/phosphomutase